MEEETKTKDLSKIRLETFRLCMPITKILAFLLNLREAEISS